MSRLLETIRIVNGRVQNIRYHNQRCNRSRRILFARHDHINLRSYIQVPSEYKMGIVKCRIIYDTEIHTISYEHYKIKHMQSVKIVHAPAIEYQHKYNDRKALDALYKKKGNCDDIIIVKNGKITDSYYCNLAFLKNGIWYTPAHSLLDGTMRTLLLGKKKIKAKQILLEEISTYESISFFNAMIPFKEIVISTDNVDLVRTE